MDATEITVVVVSFSILVGYHVGWLFVVHYHPYKTVIGITRKARNAWAKSMIKSQNGILAIQTIRNWLMQASLLASTTVALTVGLVALVGSTTSSGGGVTNAGSVAQAKFALLAFCFLASFFCFSQAMRIFNHAGLLITITPTDMPLMQTSTRRSTLRRSRDHSCTGAVVEEAEISSSDLITTRIEDDFYIDVEFLSGLLNRAGLFQTFGMRFFYLTFPFIAWVFGVWFLFGASLMLTLVLYSLDMQPPHSSSTTSSRPSTSTAAASAPIPAPV